MISQRTTVTFISCESISPFDLLPLLSPWSRHHHIKYTTMVKQWKLTANAIVIASSIGEHDYVCEACMTLLKTKAGKSANNTDSGMDGFLTVLGTLDGLIDATEPAAGEEDVEDASAGEGAAAVAGDAEVAEEADAGAAAPTAAAATTTTTASEVSLFYVPLHFMRESC